MNGAQAVIRTLAGCGVDACFSNPGTSEMHFVAALDAVPAMRGVLCLFEGVATGAADGYGRMTGRPAAALLHLGPGLANGLANLHNARRAATPLVAVIGDHATYHKRFDAPLESDIDALAGSVSRWVRRPGRSADAAADAAEAVAAALAPPGGVATLILPADVSWSEGGEPAAALPVRRAAAGPRRGGRRGRGGAAQRRALRDPARRRRGPPPRPGRSEPDRQRHRRPVAVRDLPGPARARRGPPGGRPAGLPGRVRDRAVVRRAAPDPGRRARPGLVLRLPGPAQFPGARRLPGAHARRERRRRVRRARGAGRSGRRRTPGRCRSSRSVPGCRTAT